MSAIAMPGQELLYQRCSDSDTGRPFWIRHRILKRTRQRVVIDRKPFLPLRPDGSLRPTGTPRPLALDRAALEQDGCVLIRNGLTREVYCLAERD